jgi:hypothetical protein
MRRSRYARAVSITFVLAEQASLAAFGVSGRRGVTKHAPGPGRPLFRPPSSRSPHPSPLPRAVAYGELGPSPGPIATTACQAGMPRASSNQTGDDYGDNQ